MLKSSCSRVSDLIRSGECTGSPESTRRSRRHLPRTAASTLARSRATSIKYLRSPLTGLVVLGSNGEAPQLDEHEADLAIKTVRDAMPKDRPLLAGTGRESTAATIAATKRAADLGVDAVLVRTPSFYKGQMTTDAFVRHYTRRRRSIAGAGAALQRDDLHRRQPAARSRRHPQPPSEHRRHQGNQQRHGAVRRVSGQGRDGFTVLAGSGATYYSALALGAHGAILAVGGVAPNLCVDIFNAVRDGRFDEARRCIGGSRRCRNSLARSTACPD